MLNIYWSFNFIADGDTIIIKINVMGTQDLENIIKISGETPNKCIFCKKHIIYPNTNFELTKTGKLKIKGYSWKTEKIVNGNTYKLCVCHNCMKLKFKDIDNFYFSVMYEPTKYAFQISHNDYIHARKKYAMTLSHMIEKYGEEEGKVRWENYCKKQSETNTFEYKNKKYGWTKDEFDAYNKTRAVTLNNMINRYGEEEGKVRWEKYVSTQQLTKSRDWMIEKYGEEKTNEINSKKRLSLTNFIKKYGEEEGKVRWKKYCENKSKPYSKAAHNLFLKFDKYLPKGLSSKHSDNEYFITHEDRSYFLDYYIPELNICIEYNGDSWHGNPKKYKDLDKCHPIDRNITAKELQQKDENRYNILLKHYNIKTYVLWESDVKNIDIKKYLHNIILEHF